MNPVDGFRLDCPNDAGEDLMNSVEDKGSGQILCPDDSGEDLMNHHSFKDLDPKQTI